MVHPVTMADADGARIYRRSLTFLLEAVYEELFPGSTVSVDHSVASGGFFCSVSGRDPMELEDLSRLETRMRKIITMDLPFEKAQVPLPEVVAYFKEKGLDDKVQLMKYRNKPSLVLYTLKGHRDYHHGYMVPSTGYLKWFGIIPLENGFILQFPRRHIPWELQPLPETRKLLQTFLQYGNWLNRLGIDNVGCLNDAIQENRIREVILVSEALHEQKIAEIATRIVDPEQGSRIILIAGPSSSGKTTFSKRLAVQLLAQGLSPFPLELDNYFVDREATPRDENGDYDFESLKSLDTRLLGENLRDLVGGKKVTIPHYDFKEGKRKAGEIVQLDFEQLIILEGIHGLNPDLIPDIPPEHTFRIYVSALTQLNLDRHNRISTTDTRLIRRIVRDARERGYSARQTIGRWESVRRGEKRHIFPYQENASEMFNSALVYELAALKPLAEPLLRQVPFGTDEFIEAKRLLAFLDWFLPLDAELIPDNSILREFIGNSILKEFKIWRNGKD
jgi:uridine kinase